MDPDIAYTRVDTIQRLPIAVEQPGSSAFSRVDVTQNRPVAVDPIVQYDVYTSANVDYLRLATSMPSQMATSAVSSAAPLPSPSIHWKKRFSYDYIPPDTLAGAPIQAAPTTQSVYIGPQTSVSYTDTHTHTHTHTTNQCVLVRLVIWCRAATSPAATQIIRAAQSCDAFTGTYRAF